MSVLEYEIKKIDKGWSFRYVFDKEIPSEEDIALVREMDELFKKNK